MLITTIVLHKRTSNSTSLDKRYFQRRWVRLQKLCSDKKLWYKAIVDADELLDEALETKTL
ncbi:MAG: hypothetical protein WDN66_04860 [Candidatus Saccharibacteria bacterium]